MTANIGEIVAQLRQAIERIDKAAVAAMRIAEDANTAQASFVKAGTGSDHPKIRRAIADASEARTKGEKIARLFAESANAFADYINVIAPGGAPTRRACRGSSLSGDQLVEDTESRASKADRAFRKQMRKADDTEDALKKTEDAGKAAFKYLKQQPPGSARTTPGTVPPQTPPLERPQVDNPITAIVMATGAMVVAGKAALDHAKKRRERKADENDSQD